MKRFKDSAKTSASSKIVGAFKFEAEVPENFEKAFVKYKEDIYSLCKKPSGNLELGVYLGGVKLNYRPIKEFTEFSKEKVSEAIDNYQSRVGDSLTLALGIETIPIQDLLIRAMADEIIAWWQYNSIREFLVGPEGEDVRRAFDKYGVDELMDHLNSILKRLNELGATPDRFYCLPSLLGCATEPQKPYAGTAVGFNLTNNIKSEITAIRVYQELVQLAEEYQDYVTRDLAKHILSDEQEHLTELCDLYANVTGQNYDDSIAVQPTEWDKTECEAIVSDGVIWRPEIMKISDVAESEQTDALKTELYKLTQQFVYKYWREYYPRFKGDIEDLVVDFYSQFMTKKGRGDKKESLLDKFNPKTTTLAYLVKVAVKRMLIDRARSDKGEVSYAEKYDEETGDLTLDFLASKMEEQEVSVDDIEFTEDDYFYMRDLYDELTEAQRKHFLRMYREVKDVLSPNFKALFKDLTGF